MEYSIFSHEIQKSYPSLVTEVILQGNSSVRYFFLPEGFKDIGVSIVFGYLNLDSMEDLRIILNQLDEIALKYKAESVVGPLNFTTFFDYRAKLDHFDLPSFPGEPRNTVGLPEVLYEKDYQVFKRYYSHKFDTKLNLKFHYSIIFMGLWGKLRTLFRYRAAFINSDNYLKYLPEIYQITIDTFGNNFLFMPISFSAFKIYFENQILPYIHYETSVMIFDNKHQLVGYSLCLKDPHNKEHLLFKTIGVVKNHRKGGFLALQIMRMVYLNARKNFHLCIACLMIEGNKIDRIFKAMSLLTIQYGLFQKKLKRGS